MYICINCRELFEEPKECIETHGLEVPPYEHFYVCPRCGSTFVETYKCSVCNEYITGIYAELDDGSMVCAQCYVLKDIIDE